MSTLERSCFRLPARAPIVLGCLLMLSARAHAQSLDAQYSGAQMDGKSGFSVSSGFDCDGDGIDDVAIGAPDEDGNYISEGFVRIYSGATHALLRTLSGGSAGARFGHSVALVGDVDGDGYGDVAVGAPDYSAGAGFVATYSVRTGALLWTIVGGSNEAMGFSVAAAGDVDHDGHMDVVVGAPGGDNVYLFGWGTGALHVWHSSQTFSQFGHSVSGNVDVDGDGTMDVIIGTPYYDSVFPLTVKSRGRVDVYSGATYLHVFGDIGDKASDHLGLCVCGLGDVNHDGKSEVLASTSDYILGGVAVGLVRKYDSSGTKISDLYGPTPPAFFGYAIARVPDVDGDGLPEYAVGAIQFLSSSTGFAELHRGFDDKLLWTYAAPGASDQGYGWSLAGGDVNGDGTGDLVIGAPIVDVGSIGQAGRADVWVDVNATAVNYGSGYPGTLGVPNLTALSDPGIGKTFTASVGNSRGSATTGIVFLGFARLNQLTSAGGTLLVSPFQTFVLPIPTAGGLLSGALPNDASLLGVIVDLQVLESDPGAAHKLSFTAGLELRIGVDY